jgi:hypothetical protein
MRVKPVSNSTAAAAGGSLGRSRAATLGLLAAALSASVALSACRQPLFPRNEPRSQYDEYDVARDEYAAPYIEDEFGRQRPNLRGRLAPR